MIVNAGPLMPFVQTTDSHLGSNNLFVAVGHPIIHIHTHFYIYIVAIIVQMQI